MGKAKLAAMLLLSFAAEKTVAEERGPPLFFALAHKSSAAMVRQQRGFGYYAHKYSPMVSIVKWLPK